MIPKEARIGLHTVRIEPPDLIVIIAGGDFGADDVRELIAEIHEFTREHPKPLLLLDATRLARFHPAARKVAMGLDKSAHGRAFAIVGAGFHQRVVLTLLNNALALITKVPHGPMSFFDTQAEARAWFEGQK